MRTYQFLFCVALAVSYTRFVRSQTVDDLADEFVTRYTAEAAIVYNANVKAAWNYNTNITDETLAKMSEESLKSANFTLFFGTEAKLLFDGKLDEISDESYRRQIESIMILGTANLDEADQIEYNRLTASMEATYSTAEAVMPDGRSLPLDPDLSAIMAQSRDYQELKYAWKGWYEASGRPVKDDYESFVTLSNTASAMDGFADTGEYWRSWYEMSDLEAATDELWLQLEPMYKQLHAFVRRRLYNKYGPDYISLDGPIPAHLLGNMWAQQWGNIYDMVEPYPGKAGVDATPGMLEQGYDAKKMFEVSEEFFTSLNLEPMTEEFWNRSMIEKPDDGRDVVCHASAWDFYDQKDFRIKQCTVVTMESLITVHHEMGHIQYFQQYKDQPIPFRGGANPGFHEAVGDTLALSVSTPKHLNEIGLLDEVESDEQADINYLMSQAMDKIAFLPFGFLMDKWRWRVFDGTTAKADYQSSWDDLRLKYQGIVPPVERDGTVDFDPGAKFHIPANTPYIRYFVSFVIQFQFYKEMCDEANHTESLYQCDFYRSHEAGAKLAAMLKLGASRPWQEAMTQMLGSGEMSIAPLVEYFEPLTTWLEDQNSANNEVIGWDKNQAWRPKGYLSVDGVPAFLETYNATSELVYNDAVEAEWAYNTNINAQTQAAAEAAGTELSKFLAEQAQIAKLYEPSEITDTNMRRQIAKISVVGDGALSDDKLQELAQVSSKMQTSYSTAQYCSTENDCKPLDPDLTATMASSRDYNELRDTWKGWRDAIIDKDMRADYGKYIDLQNEIAVLNNYPDMGAFWLSAYETPNMQEQLETVWQEMIPLYEQLHAFVRRRLYNHYGAEVINLKGPIPAHLLGNMWAQDWLNLYDLLEPYEGLVRPDATKGLQEQGWTVMQMFEVADDFFGDMGLERCPEAFWNETMYVRPSDREVVCHASAWDFYNRKDFRVKMCTEINQNDFVTIHHELGHIQYYLQYKDQPTVFRDGANPGFHEAVGDTLSLSVGTLEHLFKLGLIEKPEENPQADVNYLMSVALDKIAFIPFGYLMDKWRWDVFSERISKANLNQGWWDYRLKYQGVAPPLPRTELDFDPGAKFHIPNDVPYIRYFVSVIVQFQFYETMCEAANFTGPLYKCDFNGSLEAGKKFGDMLKLGSSLTWEEALEAVTGSRVMSSASLIRYYQPLMDFLKQENEKNKEVIGWPEYSWQPPTNTVVNADRTVSLEGGNSASGLSSGLLSIAFVALHSLLKMALE